MSLEHIGWLNTNELRAYPFHEGADRVPFIDEALTVSAAGPISDKLFVDFKASVSGNSFIQLYLSKLVVADGTVNVIISGFITFGNVFSIASIRDQISLEGFSHFEVFEGTASLSESEFTVMMLTPRSTYATSSARLVLGRRDDFISDGIYYFRADQSIFEPCLIEAGSDTVTRITVQGADGSVTELSGSVNIVAGSNIVLTVDVPTNSLIINAIPGEGYITGCDTTGGAVVETVNGIALKDLIIESGNECIEVTTSGNTIAIKDKCSTPCCGCEELQLLTQKLVEMAQRLGDEEQFRLALSSSINTLQSAITNLPAPV